MKMKNIFFIYNNVLSELYRCRIYNDLGQRFLPMLKMLIPFRYASIMRSEEQCNRFYLLDPLCLPAEFLEAERNYMRFADDDQTGWLSHCRQSTIFRESDLMTEQQRLSSPIYQKCYQKFDVYDSLEYGIVCNGRPLGTLSLFRGREDGPFTDDELFLLTSVGLHLNQQMDALVGKSRHQHTLDSYDLASIATKYGLTARETQLLELLTRFRNNHEIAESLQVRGSTLQKHFQNMFRKLGVTSRWEVMRLLFDLCQRG